VVAAGPAGIEVARLQERADATRRVLQLAVGAAEDERLTRGRFGETEQHPQRAGLAGAVGSQEPRDRALHELEGEAVDRGDRAVALGQHADADRRRRGESSRPWHLVPLV